MNTANYNILLDGNWKFCMGDVKQYENKTHLACAIMCQAGGALGELPVFENENNWQDITLPHDWLTDVDFDKAEFPSNGYKPRDVGWYYTKLSLPENPIENAELVFEGVMGQSTVYVNGVIATWNHSGYNRFSCDISDYLLCGEENIIAVYVDARHHEGWWYEGAGIYRPVYIRIRENSRFEWQNAFVRSAENNGQWQIIAETPISGDGEVVMLLKDKDGNILGHSSGKTSAVFDIENPKLWSPENPYLYELECKLEQDGISVDTLTFPVGVRSILWTSDKGMYLNGKPYPIKGICCHQDHAGVGAAVPKCLTEYRIKKLKELGANAYRCAHHQPSTELLEICDRLGMLVMVENRHFSVSDDVLCQLETLAKVSRNHPSVFLYSLFNEEPWQKEKRGLRIARRMYEHIRKFDSTRAVTGAMNDGHLNEENASDTLDVIGLNYALSTYEECHKRSPHKPMLGTENCPMLTTRGVYETDSEKQIYSNYGEDWPTYFSQSMDETMELVGKTPFVAGCFAWSGFDYRGEPQPKDWPSVLSHWGVMDYCGFEKDIFYWLRAWYSDELTAHILPHWNHKDGETVRVCTYTNGDTAELFVNGRSFGEKKVEKMRAEWNVTFESGIAEVVVKRGNDIVADAVSTAAKPYKIVIDDVSTSKDLHILNLSVVDKSGIIVPDFDGSAEFDMPKSALLGVGNGDPNSHHAENVPEIRFFNGRAQVIARSIPGCRMVARCDGLPDAKLDL